MKKHRKRLVVSIINLMAFASLLVIVFNNFGVSIFLQVLIPSSIIMGTNLATLLCMPLSEDKDVIHKKVKKNRCNMDDKK
ncbi:MAG: hypothetical protein J1E60_01385 [Christensenellaceae bacterium]|nr:hypothetical protein [Christensenellaceae bacterium]